MSFQIVTKRGDKRDLPDLFAFNGGIWEFPFYGDETFTDPFDSSVWYWVGVTNDVDEILTIVYQGIFLIKTTSLADCRAQNASFFWDDATGVLYVHWFDFGGDWYFAKTFGKISQIIAGFANSYSKISQNVFDGVFYDPVITDISGLAKTADLTKLGLVTFEESTFSLTDQENALYQETGTNAVGIPLWVYLIDKNDTTLTDDKRIFTGVYNGYKHDRTEIQYQLTETRFFQNTPICPNTASIDDYSNIGDNEGELIPVAWGQIRRGILLLTNKTALTTAASGTAVFLVADPALGSVLAISNVYNEAGDIQTITGTNLTSCTVDVTKPAGVSVGDLKDWTWGGQGYNITGTYNNGLDIIRAAYLSLAQISYTASTFDQTNWSQAVLDNPQAIELSVKSEKGFVEELIEPITTSLQGVVDILGDGRISWASRDTSSKPIIDIPVIKAKDQLQIPIVEVDPKETVSELQINYSPNFQEKEPLTKVYSDLKTEIIAEYTIDRREPLSPVETVLADEADVEPLAVEIMDTSAAPVRRINVESLELLTEIRFFDIVGIDTGTFGNENIEYGEFLSIEPDYNEYTQSITIRIIPGYEPLFYAEGDGFSSKGINEITSGMSDKGINQISTGFGFTTYN
jgi:hypothetical protein